MSFPVADIRKDFPILQTTVKGKPLIYLDNAATSQKPLRVINAITEYYEATNSNIHRGAHYLANKATEQYENSRKAIAQHLNAKTEREINFVRGTTEAINLVAKTWGRKYVKAGDEIIISALEHHSNIVPWQMLCEEVGANLLVIPVDDKGEQIFEAYEKLLSEKTKLVSTSYISNSLGTINPVHDIVKRAHAVGAKVFIDAAQALPHMKVDVQDIDCDWLGFSGHKVFGPTGIGILYGKEEVLLDMPPFMGGGEMIKTVSFKGTTYNDLPYKFEAGTPNIEGGIVLGEAIHYINGIGLDAIYQHEEELLHYATDKLTEINGLRVIGTAAKKASVLSFLVGDIHPYDLGVLLNEQGIAIRTGHHCCQPIMDQFGIEGTCRASFAFYNTFEEIDALADAIRRSVKILG
ncbi:MAG: cysteine desulfurase [Bacteroidetes bacterium]|nr:cysteine desulfurase [Bacteroidota bacterium]